MYLTIKVQPDSETNLEDAINAKLNEKAETHDVVSVSVPTMRTAIIVFKVKP